MLINMREYCELNAQCDVNIFYSGPVRADCVESIAAVLKLQLQTDELPRSTAQSIFSVFVEQLNNVLMYSELKDKTCASCYDPPGVSMGAFAVEVRNKVYYLQSGNVIKASSAEMIKNRIDYLNSLSKDELHKFYKQQLKGKNQNPESRGAGVGLIEIARRANSKIEYSFEQYGEGLMFFTLLVKI